MATKVKLIETGAVTGNIIPDGGIATGKLADDAVTTIKISDANITHAKLHTSMDLTGKTVTVATASGSTNTTAAASTAFVQQELTTLIGGAPSTLNDLNELAAAINDDANYNSTLTTALATKATIASPRFTGSVGIGQNSPTSPNDATDFLHIGSASNQDTSIVLQDAVETWEIYQNDDLSFLFDTTNVMTLQRLTGNVGIGTTNPAQKLHVSAGSTNANTIARLQQGTTAGNYSAIEVGRTDGSGNVHITPAVTGGVPISGTAGILLGSTNGSIPAVGIQTPNSSNGHIVFNPKGSEKVRITADGDVGIGTTNPQAQLQVKQLGINVNQSSVTSTSQYTCDSMSATAFRSARYTVQVTNVTDSTYQITEILLIHDGTTPSMTEYSTIFTGSAREASFDADISSSNVRLLATPASTDSMQFKVVRHSILV